MQRNLLVPWKVTTKSSTYYVLWMEAWLHLSNFHGSLDRGENADNNGLQEPFTSLENKN